MTQGLWRWRVGRERLYVFVRIAISPNLTYYRCCRKLQASGFLIFAVGIGRIVAIGFIKLGDLGGLLLFNLAL